MVRDTDWTSTGWSNSSPCRSLLARCVLLHRRLLCPMSRLGQLRRQDHQSLEPSTHCLVVRQWQTVGRRRCQDFYENNPKRLISMTIENTNSAQFPRLLPRITLTISSTSFSLGFRAFESPFTTFTDSSLTPMSDSVHTSPTESLDPGNVGVAFRISLLSSIEADILRYVICTSSNGDHLWFTTYLMSDSVHICSTVLLDPENVGVAFGILLLSCVSAKIKVLPV